MASRASRGRARGRNVESGEEEEEEEDDDEEGGGGEEDDDEEEKSVGRGGRGDLGSTNEI